MSQTLKACKVIKKFYYPFQHLRLELVLWLALLDTVWDFLWLHILNRSVEKYRFLLVDDPKCQIQNIVLEKLCPKIIATWISWNICDSVEITNARFFMSLTRSICWIFNEGGVVWWLRVCNEYFEFCILFS